MDRLCLPYFQMTTGLQSQLCNDKVLLRFVDDMHEMIKKSAPLKNFLFDTTTPHGDVILTESGAFKPAQGWITLQATEGIRGGIHEWCIKIESQGETTDGSGMMLGIVPSSYCRYDTFISQGGGWCLSRAGKFYGQWRKLNLRNGSTNNTISFGTNDRVILQLDYDAARLSVRVGSNMIVGEISNLAPEVFPAVSLHYKRQQVRFEYHVVHNRNARELSWVDRPVLRPPTAFLPLTPSQLQVLKLDNYVFSTLFADAGAMRSSTKRPHPESSLTDENGSTENLETSLPTSPHSILPSESHFSGPANSPNQTDESFQKVNGNRVIDEVVQKGKVVPSFESASARLFVLCNAFCSVRRYVEGAPLKPTYLSSNITPEYLRKRLHESKKSQTSFGRGAFETRGSNATFDCAAVILSHLFSQVAGDSSASLALPLLFSLMDYLESLPLFYLAESEDPSFLSPDIVQVATDNIVKLVENILQNEKNDPPLNPLIPALIELVILIGVQRGLVSETLRACRFLFKFPKQIVSSRLYQWLRKNSFGLCPKPTVPQLHAVLRSTTENHEALIATGIDPKIQILSAAFYNDMIYLHTTKDFSKWGKNATTFVKLFSTSEPSSCVNGATRSSVAASSINAFLITDKMLKEGICVVVYSITLAVQNIYYLKAMSELFPITPTKMPLIASGPMNQLIIVYNSYSRDLTEETGGSASTATCAANQIAAPLPLTGASSSLSSSNLYSPDSSLSVHVHAFDASSFPRCLWSTVLQPHSANQFNLSHCLSLEKSGMIDLGSPEKALSGLGGHVTVEMCIILLDKVDSATLYQHGNRQSRGEVFIEVARLEGAYCFRGGYRHDSHGSSVVYAALPIAVNRQFLHIALVFNGAWRLFFDGIEVGGSVGLQASVSSPRQKWTVGSNCTCYIAGLRVWCVSRSSREISRDYMRALSGEESGLVCNMFFNEPGGNVVFNYSKHPHAHHGICSGEFKHLPISDHPWKTYFSSDTVVPVQCSLHNWADVSACSIFTTGGLVGLVHEVKKNSPYSIASGRVVTFFDSRSGVALLSTCIIGSQYDTKGNIGCDHAGNLFELIESKSLSASGSSTESIISLVSLSREEKNIEENSDISPCFSLHHGDIPVHNQGLGTMQHTSQSSPVDDIDTRFSPMAAPLSLKSENESMTFLELGTWLLQLLAARSMQEDSANGELYSHLADDVSRHCVEEMKTLLIEHFRVVKGSNARRAVSFKSPASITVISSVLCILLRLVRRARDFSLHPSTLGLSIIEEGGRSELSKDSCSWIRRIVSSSNYLPVSPSNNRTGNPSSNGKNDLEPSAPANESGDTLLALLGDIVNESGTTVATDLGNLAKAVLFVGIELFFPDLRSRVNILREMLGTQAPGSDPVSPTLNSSLSSLSLTLADKPTAVELLMNAMVSSLGSIHNVMPLLKSIQPEERKKTDLGIMPSGHELEDIQRTLAALLDESMCLLKKNTSCQGLDGSLKDLDKDSLNLGNNSNKLASSSSRIENPASNPQFRLVASLADAISCLQLLLLSTSREGSGNAMGITIRATDLYAFPSNEVSRPHVRAYYKNLFEASKEGLRLILRRCPGDSGVRKSQQDVHFQTFLHNFLQRSFFSAPLYAAITSIPLVVTLEEAEWYLEQLEELLPLLEHLRDERQKLRDDINSVATIEAVPTSADKLYDTAFFTSTWVATFMGQHVTGISSTKPNDQAADDFGVASQPLVTGDAQPLSASSSTTGPFQTEGVAPQSLAAKFCDSLILSGGLPVNSGEDPNTIKPVCLRRKFVLQLLEDTSRLHGLQRQVDPLGGKAPKEFLLTVPYMGVVAIYLSNIIRIERMEEEEFNTLLKKTMKRFFVVRANLMDKCAGKSTDYRVTVVENFKIKMRFLLCFTSVHGVNALKESSNRNPNEIARVVDANSLNELIDIQHRPDFPKGGKKRFQWAIKQVRSRLLRQRVNLVSNKFLDLNETVRLVSQLVTGVQEGENELSIRTIRAECDRRNKLALIRVKGLRHLLRILRREPSAAQRISFLMTCSESQLKVHHLHGLNGADRASLHRITSTLHQLIEWVTNYQMKIQLSTPPQQEDSEQSTVQLDICILSKMINRYWEPHDFNFLCRLSVVQVIFQHSCSIFNVDTSGEISVKEPTFRQRIHRSAEKEYRKTILLRSKQESSADEEKNHKSLLHTPEECAMFSGLKCLQDLAVQSASSLSPDLPVTTATACCTFLSYVFIVVSSELERCLEFLKRKDLEETIFEIVADQVRLLLSIIGVVVAAYPQEAQITCVLHLPTGNLARILCQFVNLEAFTSPTGSYTLCGAGCLRIAAKLLARISPRIANASFSQKEIQSVINFNLCEAPEECRVLTFFFSLTYGFLLNIGMSLVSQHSFLAMRDLLCQPAWAKLLKHLVKSFHNDLNAFTNTNDMSSHLNAALKMYVWCSTLGGCLLFVPGDGLPARFSQEEDYLLRDCFILECGKESVSVVRTNKTSMSESEDGFVDFVASLADSCDESLSVEDKDKFISEDNIFMPCFSRQVQLPSYDRLLDDFIVPAIQQMSPLIEKGNPIPVDLLSIISILSISLSMVQQPEYCEAFVRNGSIALIHQLANRCVARDPLTVIYLKEYAAYATSFIIKSLFLQFPGSSGVNNEPGSGGDGKVSLLSNSTTQGTRTAMMPPLPFRFSCSQARYTVMSFAQEALANLPPMTFSGTSPREPSSAPALLCFPVGKAKIPACVTVTREQKGGSEMSLLQWRTGIALEAAVLLSDRLFPALGEEFVIPSDWGCPDIKFDLFNLYVATNAAAGRGEEAPLLRVMIEKNELISTFLVRGADVMEVRLPLQWEDWDTFLYIGVFLDAESLTLCKGREMATKRLSVEAVAVLEEKRNVSQTGGFTLLMVGSPPQPPASATLKDTDDSTETNYVLISGIRLSDSSKSKVLIHAMADEVAREQTLSSNDTVKDACFFPLTEGSGDKLYSTNIEYSGVLHGNVRWVAHSRKGVSPVSLMCIEKLNTGTSTTSQMMIPRKEILNIFSSLDAMGLECMAQSLLESLTARLSRIVVVASLQKSLSPEYEVYLLSKGASLSFEPMKFFHERHLAKQLANLFRYSDCGVLSKNHLDLINSFVQKAVNYFSHSNELQTAFFEDTANAVRSTLHDSTEVFPIEMPSVSQASKGCPLMPMSFLNGGYGWISYDVKGRFVEHANIFKDRAQKTIIAKFPDNKGAWLDFAIPTDTPWLYVRNFAFSRHQDGLHRQVAMNVMLRSMRPAVLDAFFSASCFALQNKCPGYMQGLPHFLNSRLLISMLPRENLIGTEPDSIHASSILCSILNLWTYFPDVQSFDRCPLPILLQSINAPLVALLHQGSPSKSSDEGQRLCPALDTYNAYTRQLVAVLVTGMRLESAWFQRSYRTAVWERWRRLLHLWEQSTWQISPLKEQDTTRSGKAKVLKKHPPVLERIASQSELIDLEPVDPANSPPIVMRQRGNGEWFVRSERDVATVRSSVGFSKGRFYFQVRMVDGSTPLSIGVVTEKWLKLSDTNNLLGQDSESWCFDIQRICSCFQGCRTDFTSRVKWKTGDVAGVLIDLESNRLVCFHNDRQVSAFEKLKIMSVIGSGPSIVFPAVSFGTSGCSINFGSGPFSSRMPVGSLPVDPRHFHTSSATRLWYMYSTLDWITKTHDSEMSPSHGCLAATVSSLRTSMNLAPGWAKGVAPSPPRPIKNPVVTTLLKHVMEYAEGRSGSLSVDLLCSTDKVKVMGNEVIVEEAPCLVRGSVTVHTGKWYYEVAAHEEAGLSIGWMVADRGGEWGRNRSLGDDEYSWALEGRRMIAKHSKQQINLNRHVWKSGNVVGCLLDCDAGTISFTINGNLQREVHTTGGDGVLFRQVDCFNIGLSPAVSMELKMEVSFGWNMEDLLFLPPGYKPLGASYAISTGLKDYFLLSLERSPSLSEWAFSREAIRKIEKNEEENAQSFSADSLEKVVRFASRTINATVANISVYCLEKALGIQSFGAKGRSESVQEEKIQGEVSRFALSLGLSEAQLRSHLLVLHLFSAAMEIMFPFSYEGSLGMDSDGSGCFFSPLFASYRILKRFCLSFFNLRVLRRLLLGSNGGGENLKLTLHRRQAIALGSNPIESVGIKLRNSLFGQVYQLLSSKSSTLFCTNKKMWNVAFFGEGADDVGGPYRESLSQMCTELMGPILPLFLPSPNQTNEMGDSRETFVLQPTVVAPVDLSMYQFVGRLMGGCLRSAEPLSLYLPSLIWKSLVGEYPDVTDLERVDASTVQSLRFLASTVFDANISSKKDSVEAKSALDEELAEMIPDGFTVIDDGGTRHLLTKYKEHIPVNHRNAYFYVLLKVFFKLHVLGSAPLKALREGFFEVVPLYLVSCLKWYELEAMVCGQRDYDPDELLDNARFENISPLDKRVQYLREVLKEFSCHQRASFMRFVTGRERLPPGMQLRIMPDSKQEGSAYERNFGSEQQWNGEGGSNSDGVQQNIPESNDDEVKLSEETEPFDDERLPHASTCFYWLSLPKYSRKEILKEKLLFAIEQCVDIDADFRVHDQDLQTDNQPVLARMSVDDDDYEDYSHLR